MDSPTKARAFCPERVLPVAKRFETLSQYPILSPVCFSPMPRPTLRTLAKSLGLSRTTVSDALRGLSRVNPKTIERVQAAADAAGYQRNPLTGEVMSQMRRSNGQLFRGVLAALEIVEEPRPPHVDRFNNAVLAGARERAQQLGFNVEHFDVTRDDLRLPRIDSILNARGIRGIVVLPCSGFPDLSSLTWSRLTAVYADYFIDQPALHCVCPDHYRSMISTMQTLHKRGYRRPGLVIDMVLEERLQYRWEGAFQTIGSVMPGTTSVPALKFQELTRENFVKWFKKHDPDVVLSHFPEVVTWMKLCGAKIPEDHGFVCLNSLRASTPCAALDHQPHEIGARAAELVVGQVIHNESGPPAQPSLTSVPTRWIEGPTILAPGETSSASPARAAATASPRIRQKV
jgi:LacI family transcriptional regulator